MEPGREYRAALVNAFRAGAEERSEPAWSSPASEPVDLTVFDTWTFKTVAEAGDFEALCERLKPATASAKLGMRPVDVTKPGLAVRWPHSPMTIDLIGALVDPGLNSDAAPAGNPAFATVVVPILNDVLARADDNPEGAGYDPLRDDPVVGLPFYGSWPANATSVPRSGWAREANIRTDRRIAAGLGAKVVRRKQEELMAAAWDQLGSVREASDELNRGRLSAEVGRSWQARSALVDDGDRIGLAAPLLSFVRVAGKPARQVIVGSLAPKALADRVWLRRTPRARGVSASNTYLRGTESDAGPADLNAFTYQKVAQPEGICPLEVELADQAAPRSLFSPAAIDHADTTGLAAQLGGDQLSQYLQRALPPSSVSRRPPRRTGPATGCQRLQPESPRPWRRSTRLPPFALRSSHAYRPCNRCCRPANCPPASNLRPSSSTRCFGTSWMWTRMCWCPASGSFPITGSGSWRSTPDSSAPS